MQKKKPSSKVLVPQQAEEDYEEIDPESVTRDEEEYDEIDTDNIGEPVDIEAKLKPATIVASSKEVSDERIFR
jgi:hypothetical protein